MKKIRAALYIRVSTEEQAKEGHSLEAQEEILRKYCDAFNLVISEIYVDDGKSGKNTDRPELQRLLKDCTIERFDTVLVWKISRLSRDLKDLLILVDKFEQHGVSFISYSEKFDTRDSIGKLTLQVLGSIAEFERNTIIDNVKMTMAQVARSGKWTGGIVLGYNSVNKQLVINEEEAMIVKIIFEMYIDGKGCVQIRDKLNQLNLKTKKGLSFTQHAVINILANPVYKGFIRYGRTTNYDHKGKRKKEDQFILEKGIHEPVIDEDTFEKAQIITEQNRRQTRRMPSNPHMLSGLLRCPQCSGRMNYQPAGQRKHNDKHGGYYNCSTYKNTRECNHNTLRAKHIEKEVLERIKYVINDKQVLKDIVSEINSNNTIDTALIHKQLLETDKQINKYTARLAEIKQEFLAEKITYDDYKDFKSLLEISLTELNSKKQDMELELVKALNTSYDANEVHFVMEHFDSLMENADVQLKKQLLESLIERINLNPDKTLKNIEFKFEVPNQHVTENDDKNVILTYDTVHLG